RKEGKGRKDRQRHRESPRAGARLADRKGEDNEGRAHQDRRLLVGHLRQLHRQLLAGSRKMHCVGRKWARPRWRCRAILRLVVHRSSPVPTRPSTGMFDAYRQDAARLPPQSLAKRRQARHSRAQTLPFSGRTPMSTALTDQIYGLIEPFNKKGVELTDATTFAGDLEWDSLTVMDFVAEVEDTFDIIISMNQQAEIENVGQLVAAVEKLQG